MPRPNSSLSDVSMDDALQVREPLTVITGAR